MVGLYTNTFLNSITFRASISNKDIDSLKDAKQYFSDCYIIGTLESLAQTENGREILKEQIHRDDDNPAQINCYLYNKNGEKEKFVVPPVAIEKKYKKLYANQANDVVRSVNYSVNEYEKKYKSKPLYCRIADKFKSYSFEYNIPSHFMKLFTGIEPHTIGEKSLNINLVKYKEEVLELFNRMDKEKEHSFIISTGMKALDGHRWHVYIIQDVDMENNTITIKEKRENKPQTMSIDKALKTFKFITGYFNSDLEKNNKKEL